MVQLVSLNNKKAQKKYHAKQRGSWYKLNPVTRTVPNGKPMTGAELNEQLANLPASSSKCSCQTSCGQRRSGRRYRRWKRIEKTDRLLAIIRLSGYMPHRGYVDWDFEGRTLLHTGKYIKYPKNSNCQKWIKRVSSKKVRAYPYLPPKGNHYRRVFDYWWTLY